MEDAAVITDKTTLRTERTYQAPAQTVFDAWTSEEVIRCWWHAEHDWETSAAEVDLRIGGAVRVVMRNPPENTEYGGGGRYTEIEPPTRLAFTWIWDGDSTRQLIELDFEEADGITTAASPTAARGTRKPCAPTRTDAATPSTTSNALSRHLAQGRSARARAGATPPKTSGA